MVGIAVYLALVQPQCTEQVQPNRSEGRQVHCTFECGQELGSQEQELGSGVWNASLASQKSREGHWPSSEGVGVLFKHISPRVKRRINCPLTGCTGRIQAGYRPRPAPAIHRDPEFRGY